jgi:hypothetical protein
VYTPFGYAMIRFGEVLSFRRVRGVFPGLRIEVNNAARPRFPSGLGRLLHTVVGFNFTNSVTLSGHLLGADIESVMLMLEKRRLAAVRLESIGDYNPTALTTAG